MLFTGNLEEQIEQINNHSALCEHDKNELIKYAKYLSTRHGKNADKVLTEEQEECVRDIIRAELYEFGITG